MPDTFRFVLSNRFRAKQKAVSRAGKLAAAVEVANAQKAAAAIVQEYQEGLKGNRLGLRPLRAETVARKRKRGQARPRSPLYGRGDEERDSLYNALLVRVRKSATRSTATMTVSTRKHHHRDGGGSIALDKLLAIHEHGAFIRRGRKIIILPPRPALRIARERALRKLRGGARAPEMRRALAELINESKEGRLREMARFTARERRILDRHS